MDLTITNSIPASERNKYPADFHVILEEAVRVARSGRVACISGEVHELMRFRAFLYNVGPMDIQTRLGFEGTVLYVF
jgi:hypothetical protein